jgi:outer membrane protein assembly factor BamB
VGCGPEVSRSKDARALPAQSAEATRQNGNWPGWRGAGAFGVAEGAGVPTDWIKLPRWKVDTRGSGNSSPVIWGQRIYLTAKTDEPSRLVVQSYDRATGKLAWQADAADVRGSTHVKNGHASASIATDGSRLFAFFGSAGLFAYDMEGRPLWRRDLGELEHVWGTASSPVLFDDLVIQLCDRGEDSYIAAFKQETGEVVWKTPRESTGCWTTPVVVQAHDADSHASRSELVVNGTGTERGSEGIVIAYDPFTGKELWRVAGTTRIVCPTAIVGSELVVSTSGRNGPIIAIRPGGSGDVSQSHVLWRTRHGGPYVPTGVAYRNRLYLMNDGGVLACYNLGDGSELWKHRLSGSFTASLIAADGAIHAVNEAGEVSVVAASDQFELLAEGAVGDRCLATPALSQGQVFVRTERHLACYGRAESQVAAARP